MRRIGSLALVTAILVACGDADMFGTPLAGRSTTTAANLPDLGACDGPKTMDPVDPSTLPACCDGAHCLAKAGQVLCPWDLHRSH